MVASLHLNFGSKVESQGYPRIRSSPPKSVTRIFMTSCRAPVQTSRSMQCVSAVALLVPSTRGVHRQFPADGVGRGGGQSRLIQITKNILSFSSRQLLAHVHMYCEIEKWHSSSGGWNVNPTLWVHMSGNALHSLEVAELMCSLKMLHI